VSINFALTVTTTLHKAIKNGHFGIFTTHDIALAIVECNLSPKLTAPLKHSDDPFSKSLMVSLEILDYLRVRMSIEREVIKQKFSLI